jgi:hypothetical protein
MIVDMKMILIEYKQTIKHVDKGKKSKTSGDFATKGDTSTRYTIRLCE